MIKKINFAFVALVLVLSSCAKDKITGRRPLKLIDEKQMIGMSVKSYAEFLAKNPPLPDNDPRCEMVKKIGESIRKGVEQFCKEKGDPGRLNGYVWEFHVVDTKTVNAWCMPGGKIVVYTGLLPITQNESALAVVMGHEIAHAVARHGNERMSQALAAQTGGNVLSVVLVGSGVSQTTSDIFLQSYGIGSQLGLLKYSRKHESEADKLGLIFMALAGYDPQEAIPFWERMAKQGGGGNLEILSTHPSDERRIKDLKKFMPTALKYYKKKS
jgi:predicted Zn-dependent protease